MPPHSSLQTVEALMDRIADFITEQHQLIDCHLVNFITHDLFESLLPDQLKVDLLTLTDQQLTALPCGQSAAGGLGSSCAGSLQQFVDRAAQLSLLAALSDSAKLLRWPMQFCQNSDITRLELSNYMHRKKAHEVTEMAHFIANLAGSFGINKAVDVGTGRGYLASLLALHYGFDVVGLEQSEQNVSSAKSRQANLEKHWVGLIKRVRRVELQPAAGCLIGCDEKPQQQSMTPSGKYTPIVQSVDSSVDLDRLLQVECERVRLIDDSSFVLCGLHACGDLTAASIEAYLRSNKARLLCIVGCCYHFVEERFAANPFRKVGDPSANFYGFPMSCCLKRRRFAIGLHGRNLAAMPVNKIADKKNMPSRSLFWRALLQCIIFDCVGVDTAVDWVGSIASSCANFHEYVRAALAKLNLDIQLTDAAIDDYLLRYRSFERKIYAFYHLRSILSPLLESVIVLDRLAYLLEQDELVEDAFVVPLFDPVKSPRYLCLVAAKRN